MAPNPNRRSHSTSTDAGFVPPHDTELERALLGAMLLERNIYHDVATIVTPATFYDDRHASIFKAIRVLAENNNPVDLLTVGQQLQKVNRLQEVGGPAYLAGLTQVVGSGSHAGFHAKMLYQMAVLRAMIANFTALTSICFEGDFDSSVDEYSAMTGRIDALFAGSGTEKHIRMLLKRHGELMDQRLARSNSGEMQGLTYGLTRMDELTGGMQPGQLIIIAARPAMGKTAVALKISKSPAERQGAHVVICSLEMTDLSLTDRLLASYAGIDSKRLRTGRMNDSDWRAYEQARAELGKLNLYIDDTAGATLSRIRAMARTKRRKGELDLLVIDYLQLIENDSTAGSYKQNREREVAEISRGLKKLAKELGIPVVLLCQLNRAAESRADKQPQLSDLRESGAIEQDADLVIMPFRPSYYPELEATDSDGNTLPPNVGFLLIRKQRDGELGEVAFQYSHDLSKIENFDSRILDRMQADGGKLPF